MDDLWCGEKDMGTKESVGGVAPHICMNFPSQLIQFMFETFIKFSKSVRVHYLLCYLYSLPVDTTVSPVNTTVVYVLQCDPIPSISHFSSIPQSSFP